MKKELQKVAMRKQAIFLQSEPISCQATHEIHETTAELIANCNKLGYTFSESLLHGINVLLPSEKLEILDALKEVKGVNNNWTPLVKQWNIPTGVSRLDYIVTRIANLLKSENGTKMPCGHVIPFNTFPIERYNGCPYCGTPFSFEALDYEWGKNKNQVLDVWYAQDMENYLLELLHSPVALDATQLDDIKILLKYYSLPAEIDIAVKETLMTVIDELVHQNKPDAAGKLFKTPNDILRYLWYKHTGHVQVISPKTIRKRMQSNHRNIHPLLDGNLLAGHKAKSNLKLKYTRKECKLYASWLNNLSMNIDAQCENMHPKRGMWIRMIRALRLAEYSKKKGFENLATLLDKFYNQDYEVWQGKVNANKLKSNAEQTFELLKQRPGLFARSLFSMMLWFGPERSLEHFKEVMHQVPKRLIYSLNMYADIYFVKSGTRSVKPLGGTSKMIPTNKLIGLYDDTKLEAMRSMVKGLTLDVIKYKLMQDPVSANTMYIAPALYQIPLSIGDRNGHVQDMPHALMGTRFKVEGETIRLFMQWGNGLKAQHLDMDLSCFVAYDGRNEFCSYSQLVIPGCKHSGDIQSIPAQVGTAEYIDIDLNVLESRGARYVSFTCNAYTNGSLSANMVVGWMHSKYPMKISAKGVAYNPTAVQHQVKIVESLDKGMVFGVLDVQAREIIWLEMPFGGQVVQNLSQGHVEALLAKLDAKFKIGEVLEIKAEVQQLELMDDATQADEVYDVKWALNTAAVSQLLL